MLFFIRLIINMVAILIVSHVFPKMIRVDGFVAALVAAFVLGIVNTLLRPVLVFLTFPITLVTLGLFLLVINGLMLWLVSALVGGFHVSGFWGAVFGAICISLVSGVLSWFLPR